MLIGRRRPGWGRPGAPPAAPPSTPQDLIDAAEYATTGARLTFIQGLADDRYRMENATHGCAQMYRATGDSAWLTLGESLCILSINGTTDWMDPGEMNTDFKGIRGWVEYQANATIRNHAQAVWNYWIDRPFGSFTLREWSYRNQELPVSTTEGNWRGPQSAVGTIALWQDPALAELVWEAWLDWRTTPGGGLTWAGPSPDDPAGSLPDSWHGNTEARFATAHGMESGEWSSWATRILAIFATDDAEGTPQGYEYIDGTNDANPFNCALFEGYCRVGARSEAVWNKGKAILDRVMDGPDGTTVYDVHADPDRLLMLAGNLARAYKDKTW